MSADKAMDLVKDRGFQSLITFLAALASLFGVYVNLSERVVTIEAEMAAMRAQFINVQEMNINLARLEEQVRGLREDVKKIK